MTPTGFDCADQKHLLETKEKPLLTSASNGIESYKKLSPRARGECLDDFCPIGANPSSEEGFPMGQPNGTANGTTPSVPFDSSLGVQTRTEADRYTHSQWDNNQPVPLENPVAPMGLPNGTDFEGNRKNAP